VGVKEIQGVVMRVSRQVDWLQRVSYLKNYRVSDCNYSVIGGAIPTRGCKPDRPRPKGDAPASSYDAGAASSLAGCVYGLFGRTLPQRIY